MKDFLNKVKQAFTSIPWDKVKSFLVSNWKYFAGAGLLVVLTLILYCCTGPNAENKKESESSTESVTATDFVLDEEFQVNEISALNSLIESYYTDYAGGNQDAISAIAYPMTDNEKSYIGVYSQYIESYQNINCYSKHGLTEGAYLVSVVYDLKFYGVETLAPGMDFFYVETDADGNLFINNLYSAYNRVRMENEMDSNIYYTILQFEQQEDTAELRDTVQNSYNDALASDVDLATMISTTIPNAVTDWVDSINALAQESTEDATQVAEPTEAEEETSDATVQEDTTADSSQDDEDEDKEDDDAADQAPTLRITGEAVNIRRKASTDSDAIGKALEGETYMQLGQEGDWYKIDFNGAEGYVRSDFVEVVE